MNKFIDVLYRNPARITFKRSSALLTSLWLALFSLQAFGLPTPSKGWATATTSAAGNIDQDVGTGSALAGSGGTDDPFPNSPNIGTFSGSGSASSTVSTSGTPAVSASASGSGQTNGWYVPGPANNGYGGGSANAQLTLQYQFATINPNKFNPTVAHNFHYVVMANATASGIGAVANGSATSITDTWDPNNGVSVKIYNSVGASADSGGTATGPQTKSGPQSIVALVGQVSEVVISASANAGVSAGAADTQGSASASASADPFILVDFVATDLLIRQTVPGITDLEVKELLDNLTIDVSAGIDLASFAPQFANGQVDPCQEAPGLSWCGSAPPPGSGGIPTSGTMLLMSLGIVGFAAARRQNLQAFRLHRTQ